MHNAGSKRKKTSVADVSRIEEALYNLDDMITLPEAMALCHSQGLKFNRPQMIRWIKKYRIGIKLAGRYYVYPDELALLLQGKLNRR